MTPTPQQLANRTRLLLALRAPMPSRFTWQFNKVREPHGCGYVGCAMGLAMELGIVADPTVGNMADALSLGIDVSRAVFYPDGNEYLNEPTAVGYDVPYESVTPEMVADHLERAIINQEGPEA